MDIKEIEKYLYSTKYQEYASSISEIKENGEICKNVFIIGNKNTIRYSVKIRNKMQMHVVDSLKNLSIINDKEEIFNKYEDIFINENEYILISKWIEGKNPSDSECKDNGLFKNLAKFNINNLSDGPYTSMYCDGKKFGSIEEMIDYEIGYHKQFWVEKKIINEIEKNTEALKNGLACLINEDLNKWNIKMKSNGNYIFIDTEWLQKGLNLYQFDHLRIWEFEKNESYSINDKEKICYKTYFDELGVSVTERYKQIKAMEVLKILRHNTYWRYFKMEKRYGNEIERINIVLSMNPDI